MSQNREKMKRIFVAFLILLFMLPALGPWMPHSALQSLHVQQELHHGVFGDQHDHHGHRHDLQSSDSHSVHFDIVTYFNDYLHVDLRGADHVVLSAPLQDKQTPDYALVTESVRPIMTLSSYHKNRGHPDYGWRISYASPPAYLATQRLRI